MTYSVWVEASKGEITVYFEKKRDAKKFVKLTLKSMTDPEKRYFGEGMRSWSSPTVRGPIEEWEESLIDK